MSDADLEDKIISLRSTIAWMDLVLANVNESIVVLDENWRIIFANSYTAEILNSDRVLLLGQSFWDAMPVIKDAGSKPHRDTLPITSIASLNGVYDFQYKKIPRKLQLQASYIKALNQAVCILSDVTIEMRAENALMALQNEASKLKK